MPPAHAERLTAAPHQGTMQRAACGHTPVWGPLWGVEAAARRGEHWGADSVLALDAPDVPGVVHVLMPCPGLLLLLLAQLLGIAIDLGQDTAVPGSSDPGDSDPTSTPLRSHPHQTSACRWRACVGTLCLLCVGWQGPRQKTALHRLQPCWTDYQRRYCCYLLAQGAENTEGTF